MSVPNIFKPGEPASSAQVNANFQQLTEAVAGVSSGVNPTDAYQKGVVLASDWTFEAILTKESNGALTLGGFGGNAWLPSASGISRTFTNKTTVGPLVPPSVPATTGYMCIGVEIALEGSTVVTSLVCGPEESSAAEALKNPPAVSVGKMRVVDLVIKNTSGKYEGSEHRDRRPWARGFANVVTRNSNASSGNAYEPTTSQAYIDAANLNRRFECSGGLVRMTLRGLWKVTTEGSQTLLSAYMDGAVVPGVPLYVLPGPVGQWNLEETWEFTPSAGSHLLGWSWKTSKAGESLLQVLSTAGLQVSYRELVGTNENNGSS